MECPNCYNTGNLLKRPFVKRKGLPDQYCVRCGARVRVKYKWKNIFLLVLLIFLVLTIIQLILFSLNEPGINGGLAGGITGAVLVIFMRRPAFVNVELVSKQDKGKDNKSE